MALIVSEGVVTSAFWVLEPMSPAVLLSVTEAPTILPVPDVVIVDESVVLTETCDVDVPKMPFMMMLALVGFCGRSVAAP